MSQPLPRGRVVMTANEAAAYAVVLARAQAIACYPITPQTLIVERLAELVAGRDDVEYANVESEHSMFGYVIAASRAGVRTFTATSSQGLLYAHEQLHRASRERVPLVIVNVNRAVFAPWSIEPDLSDSMSQRDTGWIQLYCSSAQEVLDSILCAYRIAETVLLPVMVCAEGFLLSHTSEVLDVPDAGSGRRVRPGAAPARRTGCSTRTRPHAFSGAAAAARLLRVPAHVAEAMDERAALVDAVAAEFTAHFGRPKVGRARALRQSRRAESALVTIGTIGDTAPRARSRSDDDLLVVRVHAYRPFPAEELAAALARASHVCVVDRAAAFGSLGPLGSDVRSLDLPHAKAVTNFICGLGGIDVTPRRRCAGRSSRRVAASDARARLRPGGACSDARLARRDRLRGAAPAARPRRVRRLRARDQHPPRARRPGRGEAGVEDRARDPGLVLDDHRRHLAGQRVRRRCPPDPVRLGGRGGVRDQGGAAAARPRRHERSSSGPATARPATSGSPGVSAAAERNEDIVYVLNDNEAYMNTGVQKSGATPEGAWTTTTPAGAPRAGQKKDIARIMAAHGIPYVATLAPGSVPMLRDFRAKVARAAEVRGLPLPPRARRLPARLAVPDGPVRPRSRGWPSSRATSRSSSATTARGGSPSGRSTRAGRRVPRDAGALRHLSPERDRRDPGARRRALEHPDEPRGGLMATQELTHVEEITLAGPDGAVYGPLHVEWFTERLRVTVLGAGAASIAESYNDGGDVVVDVRLPTLDELPEPVPGAD